MDKNKLRRAGSLTFRATLAVSRFLITLLIIVSDDILALALMSDGPPVERVRRQTWPRGLRDQLRRAQGGRCVYCWVRVRAGLSHIDHVVPIAQGGTNDVDNLQLLCPGCNLRKGDRNDTEFRYRYRSLISQVRSDIHPARIPQEEFRRVQAASPDAPGYVRASQRTRWTPRQRVNGACIGVGVLVLLLVYLPIQRWLDTGQGGGEALATVAVILGMLAAGWMKLRAWYTGRG